MIPILGLRAGSTATVKRIPGDDERDDRQGEEERLEGVLVRSFSTRERPQDESRRPTPHRELDRIPEEPQRFARA